MVGVVINSLVSPQFPHVPMGVGGWPLGYEERNLLWSPRHRRTDGRTDGQTDRQTDRQTTCDSKTAFCTIVHRALKKLAINILLERYTRYI